MPKATIEHDFVTGDVRIFIQDGSLKVRSIPANTSPTGIAKDGKHVFNVEKHDIKEILITEEAFHSGHVRVAQGNRLIIYGD